MDPTVAAAVYSSGITGGLALAGIVASNVLGRRTGRRQGDLEVQRLAAERDSAAAQADAAQAQSIQAISAAAAGLVQPLTAQVTALTAEVAELRPLRTEVAHLRHENERLTEQVGMLQARVDVYERQRHA